MCSTFRIAFKIASTQPSTSPDSHRNTSIIEQQLYIKFSHKHMCMLEMESIKQANCQPSCFGFILSSRSRRRRWVLSRDISCCVKNADTGPSRKKKGHSNTSQKQLVSQQLGFIIYWSITPQRVASRSPQPWGWTWAEQRPALCVPNDAWCSATNSPSRAPGQC